jgi:hypothetical protein
MPAEIYNSNPTVFATKDSRANQRSSTSLWIDDLDSSSPDMDDEDEPIDSDEIFGTWLGWEALFRTESSARAHPLNQ